VCDGKKGVGERRDQEQRGERARKAVEIAWEREAREAEMRKGEKRIKREKADEKGKKGKKGQGGGKEKIYPQSGSFEASSNHRQTENKRVSEWASERAIEERPR
jgi:hypothetical protein